MLERTVDFFGIEKRMFVFLIITTKAEALVSFLTPHEKIEW